jgi:predicted phage terminase large subunit-like protein
MKLSPEIIHGFVGSVLAKRYDNTQNTPDFHMEMWDYCCSKDPLVAIAAPRMHAKSTAISHAYTLAAVMFRERRFVLLVSDTETQGTNFLNDIKEELRNNEDLIDLFQFKKFTKDTETDIICEFEDGHSFRIMVRGAEQRVRGLKWNQMRPDLIVIDDLENDEAVSSKERREKLRRWFYGALLPSKAKHGIVRMVGTILHLDSLLNRLMPEDSHPKTVKTELRSWNTAKNAWKAIRYRAHNEDFSHVLWPEMYDKTFFTNLRDDFVSKGIPEIYSQEYLNYPIDESTSYFKRGDFLEIPTDTLKEIHTGKKNVNYYIGCDLAVSTADRSDYSVFVVVAVDDLGIINVVEVRKDRIDSLQIVDSFFALQKKYRPDWFALEKGTIEKSIGPILREEMRKRDVYLNLETGTANKDKVTRARSIQARFRSGGIKFDKTASWYSELEDEFVRFPKARHDDQVDSLAWIGLTLDSVRASATKEELEEDEYLELSKDSLENGRSITTGY